CLAVCQYLTPEPSQDTGPPYRALMKGAAIPLWEHVLSALRWETRLSRIANDRGEECIWMGWKKRMSQLKKESEDSELDQDVEGDNDDEDESEEEWCSRPEPPQGHGIQ